MDIDIKNHIEEALSSYAMPGAAYKLIRHNENMTCNIEDKYLLRIHKSKDGFDTTEFYRGADMREIHENELRFIEHLGRYDICVQTPIYNKDKNLVTELSDGTLSTMLTWLPGRIVEKTDLDADLGYKLGEMTAKLHIASKEYCSKGYISYDESLCIRMSDRLAKYLGQNEIEPEHIQIMIEALIYIGNKLKQTENEYILVHSDLSMSNVLITDRGLAPIDFSLLGYSTPMLDFGSIYAISADEAFRTGAIKGYEANMQKLVNRLMIDCCFALQILLSIVLHIELWKNEEWFKKRLPEWCEEVFLPLLRN